MVRTRMTQRIDRRKLNATRTCKQTAGVRIRTGWCRTHARRTRTGCDRDTTLLHRVRIVPQRGSSVSHPARVRYR